ncbi:fucosyltransferase, partial [Helicobacter pylori]|nr:fucosyltransferase [Helicobacter pylori]
VAKDFNPKSFVNVHDFNNFDEAIDYIRYLHTHPNAYLDMLYESPLNTIDGKACFYQDLSFKKILDFFKTILENDTIYHKSSTSFMWECDLHDPLVSIDDLRADYDRLLSKATPLLELSQNTTFKIYRKAYHKSLPLLRAIRRWVKK